MIVSINSIELVKEFAKVVAESGKSVIAASGQYRVDASSLNSNKFVRTYPVREKQLIREPMTYMIFFVPFYIY